MPDEKAESLACTLAFQAQKKKLAFPGTVDLLACSHITYSMIFDEALNRRLTCVFLGLVAMTAHLPTA
jgi:hypothetical protein